jgi:uncharacterized NAD(P)/FAD-binding protein YdhS
MDTLRHPAFTGPVVAIVGGGASGTLTAVHLLRHAAQARTPVRVALIDADGRHGLGQAYATTHPAHLLNSPAGQMSALAGDPGHLLRWAGAAGVTADGFLPRGLYGRYLCDTLAVAERAAQPLAVLRRMESQVVSIRRNPAGRPLRLALAADGRVDADIAVLATGNPPPAPPCPVPEGTPYIADPWAPGALARAMDGRPAIVVGTGLTMLDVAIALTGASPRTTVYAVSRHALLPRAHRGLAGPAGGCWLPACSETAGPARLSELIWQVRTAVTRDPANWERVVDSMRPHLPRLWQGLPAEDKLLFLSRLARYWEVHRHRMPPATARTIACLRLTRRLRLLAGRVTEAVPGGDGVRVRVDHGGTVTSLSAGWLINGTGPAMDITSARDPLLRDLLARGIIRPGPLRLGIDATSAGAVIGAGGKPASEVFTLGPPLRGVRYETTAIPEIREQAAALARHIVDISRARAHTGSAA